MAAAWSTASAQILLLVKGPWRAHSLVNAVERYSCGQLRSAPRARESRGGTRPVSWTGFHVLRGKTVIAQFRKLGSRLPVSQQTAGLASPVAPSLPRSSSPSCRDLRTLARFTRLRPLSLEQHCPPFQCVGCRHLPGHLARAAWPTPSFPSRLISPQMGSVLPLWHGSPALFKLGSVGSPCWAFLALVPEPCLSAQGAELCS